MSLTAFLFPLYPPQRTCSPRRIRPSADRGGRFTVFNGGLAAIINIGTGRTGFACRANAPKGADHA